MRIRLLLGDSLTKLQSFPENSVDSVVCDPPYGISFMGKKWDYDVPSVEIWQQVLRVLKPGGHLLAFAGTRTQHRMACRIEDAGFEIRDLIMWVYGSGFPKSLDVSKAIDKAAGAEREVVGTKGNSFDRKPGGGDAWGEAITGGVASDHVFNITAPATDAAKQWQGYHTALKPACEPITMARKPLAGTVAENVLQYGTGAINVDGCRVGTENLSKQWDREWNQDETFGNGKRSSHGKTVPDGRFPANIIHDGSEEVVSLFPETAPAKQADRGKGKGETGCYGVYGGDPGIRGHNDAGGSAARFFYCAKASKRERGTGNNHPTVKPVALMRYLCRLVTPPDGLILDPFMGSGSTGVACVYEGFRFLGIELQREHFETSKRRILEAKANK